MTVARERSPNYPSIGLETAVEYARALYQEARRSTISGESVAKACGYESMSGPARSKIAALRQYGLIERAGENKYRLSAQGLTFNLHEAMDLEYVQALEQAALSPALFRELWESHNGVSDSVLRIHLIRDRQFSEEGALRAIRAYRETLAFARLGERSYDGDENESTRQPSFTYANNDPGAVGKYSTITHGEHSRPESQFPTVPSTVHRTGASEPVTAQFNWLLTGGVNAQLTFAGNAPTVKAIDRLKQYLDFMKEDLQPGEQQPANEEKD